jgi:hypothetical protein
LVEDLVLTVAAIDTEITQLEGQIPRTSTTTATPTATPQITVTPTLIRRPTPILPKTALIQTADAAFSCTNGYERTWASKLVVNLSVTPNVRLPNGVSYELIAYESGYDPLMVGNGHVYVIARFGQTTSANLDVASLNPDPRYRLVVALFFANPARGQPKRIVIGQGDCVIKIVR